MAVCYRLGGWHPTSLDALSKLGRGEGREEEEVVRQLRQRLRGLLTRDNVAMMGSRAQTIPPAEVDGDIDNDFVYYCAAQVTKI